jgi:hypothetical protein
MDGMKGKLLEKLIDFLQGLEGQGEEKSEMGEMPMGDGDDQMGEDPKGKLEMIAIEGKPEDKFNKMKGC